MEESRVFSGSRPQRTLFIVLTGLLFGAFAVQLVYHAVRTSATVDEPAHILAGYRHLQCGDYGINPEHPPLLKMLAVMPLIFRDMAQPPWECGSKMTSKVDSFLYGIRFVIDNGPDATVIPPRLMASLMALLLAVVVFVGAWRMFGRLEALVALALVAFEPNFIANGSLVTTDVTLSAAGFVAMFALYEYCRKPNLKTFIITGLAIGFLLASKHSAILFLPTLFLLPIADLLIFNRSELDLKKTTIKRIGMISAAFIIGLACLWSLYGFRYRAIPSRSGETVSVHDLIVSYGRPEMINSFSARAVEALDVTHLLPQSYVLGLADIVGFGSRNMVFWGKAYPTGQWFYFPAAFLIKSSIPLLFLLPLGIAFCFFVRKKHREMMFVLLPPIVFFGIALTSQLNIGVRHILPVYPFFIVAAAAGAVWVARKSYVFQFLLVALLAYHAVTAIRIAPDYMAFANDLWGGPSETYRYFEDPNLGWGESDKAVRDYVEREGITDCWYAFHGLPDLTAVYQPCRLLPGTFNGPQGWAPLDPVPPVIEGTIILTAHTFPPRGSDDYLPIIQSGAIDRINPSLFVYRGRFEVSLLSAISHADRANILTRLKRFDEAIVDGQTAVQLAPDDPRTHLALARAFAGVGRKDEARQEFERTIENSRSNPMFRGAGIAAQIQLQKLNGK